MSNQTNNDVTELTVEYEVDGQKIKLTQNIVQSYIVGDTQGKITLQEFKFFTELCKARQLNPFLREAYLVKYSNDVPAQIVVGKDAIVKRANRHPQYNGKESGVIVEFENGESKELSGCYVPTNSKLVGGWCRVYRKDRTMPEYCSVSLEEVIGRKRNGEVNSNWSGKPATMVEKVAKVRALREAFVEDLGGMYDREEFQEFNQKSVKEDVINAEIKDVESKEVDINEI